MTPPKLEMRNLISQNPHTDRACLRPLIRTDLLKRFSLRSIRFKARTPTVFRWPELIKARTHTKLRLVFE